MGEPGSGEFYCEPRVFVVEGGVGAGKSTLLESLAASLTRHNVVVMPEPLEKWKNLCGTNLLQQFYALGGSGPGGVAFTFQAYVTWTMLQRHDVAVNFLRDGYAVVLERSLASALIFTRLNRSRMTEEQSNAVREGVGPLAEARERDFVKIYLVPSDREAIERTRRRARRGEEATTDEYIARCNEAFRTCARQQNAFTVTEGSPDQVAHEVLNFILSFQRHGEEPR